MIYAACVLLWGEVAERTVRPAGVVILAPGLDLRLGIVAIASSPRGACFEPAAHG